MRFFSTKKTLYSGEDIETIKELIEIFIENLNRIIRVDMIDSLIISDVLSSWFREDLLEVLIEKGYDINNHSEFINMIPIGFYEIFLLYSLNINYRFPINSCKITVKNFMFTGKGIIIKKLYEEDFFNARLENKNNIMRKLVKKSKKGELPSCPFHHVDNNLKDNFFDTVWNFIDSEFFPNLFQKFAVQRNQYIQLINQGDEKGRIALFHLGLLGTYERGEL